MHQENEFQCEISCYVRAPEMQTVRMYGEYGLKVNYDTIY